MVHVAVARHTLALVQQRYTDSSVSHHSACPCHASTVVDMEIRSNDVGPAPCSAYRTSHAAYVLKVCVLTAAWPAPWAAWPPTGFPCSRQYLAG